MGPSNNLRAREMLLKISQLTGEVSKLLGQPEKEGQCSRGPHISAHERGGKHPLSGAVSSSALNVNIRATHGHPEPSNPSFCDEGCSPRLIPCPIPPTVTLMVRLGECTCFHRGGRNASPPPTWVHTETCPGSPILVTLVIGGGDTWAESDVADVVPPSRATGRPWSQGDMDTFAQVGRWRWQALKALLLGHTDLSSLLTGPLAAELLTQRDAMFCALAALVRQEQATAIALQQVVAAVPRAEKWAPVVEAGTSLNHSARILQRFVEHLVDQVGAP